MKYKNLVFFVMLSIAWGTAFNAIKVGLNSFPPVLFAGIRYSLAGAIMLSYAYLVTDRFFPKSKEEFLQVLVAGFFMIACYHSFLFVGELKVTSSVASIIVSLSPVLTTGTSKIILPEEKIDLNLIIGLLLGLIGVIILFNPGTLNILKFDFYRFLIFLAAFSFAIGSTLTRFIDTDMPPESLEAWAMVTGTLFMLITSQVFLEESLILDLNVISVGSLVYLSIISSAFGFLLYFNLLRELGPIEVNLVSYSAPIFATLLGIFLLKETLSLNTIIAFLFIFIGFISLKKDSIRREISKWR
ncbi:MAG: Permease of the drug/metabolite transporter, DMT superfamily [Candidatus Methanohalarchaeum thermophilum]|uniref:Permease of the drug/metabolite transporter, DMT superfamily n=1 Tax=Methanohalarchaeum thermophilum TaxID=1903181 RepID=A0A1Q6DW82_METT1|nr:MAG: Permease of the drug/metabolite transporter, DMT superfamily [Candidatus Methanohalarchaeum thermophilum]